MEEPVAATDQSLDLIMPDDVTPESPEPVVTATMADLHVQQGLYDQAREIYSQLLEKDPGNAELKGKLEALEGQDDAGQAVVPASPSQRFSVAVTGGESARDMLLAIAGASSSDRLSRPKPRVQQPAMPSSESAAGSAESFDQFFGNPTGPEPAATADPADAEGPAPGQREDKAFQSWLKDLKT